MVTAQTNTPKISGTIAHKKTKFCLCVDYFGVQYFSKEDMKHLIYALQDKYI